SVRLSRDQSAFEQRLGPIIDHLRWIEIVLAAEPVTLGASAVGAVKRKGSRFQLRHVDSATRAGETSRIKLLFTANNGNLHQAAREFHRQTAGHLQAVHDSGHDQQTVNDDFDRVILPLVVLDFIFQVYQFAIYT